MFNNCPQPYLLPTLALHAAYTVAMRRAGNSSLSAFIEVSQSQNNCTYQGTEILLQYSIFIKTSCVDLFGLVFFLLDILNLLSLSGLEGRGTILLSTFC